MTVPRQTKGHKLENMSEPVARKRKAASGHVLAESTRTTKQQKKLPPLSEDAKLLLRIVTKSEESALRRALANSILSASPSELKVTKKLLGSLVSSAQNPLHCVRCHSSYVEQENNSRACKISHEYAECLDEDASDDYPVWDYDDEDDDDDYRRDDYDMMRYPCCGERFREDRPNYAADFCVEAKHTTDPRKVDYFVDSEDEYPVKSDRFQPRLDYASRWKNKNPQVITCKEKGCPRS